MELRENKGVMFYVFRSLEETGFVRHCFSTRKGGVSEGVYAKMNVAYGRGDQDENVNANIECLCAAAGFDRQHIVFTKQVHGTTLFYPEIPGRGKSEGISDTDGFLTNKPGIAMMTFYADCVPLYFVDPVNKAVALSHAGWKGTVLEMGRVTVEALKVTYGCETENILAGIGPSIGPCCFEVHEPVAAEFMEKLPYAHRYITKKGEKYHVDLWAINRHMLLEAGLKDEHIETAGICTRCNQDLFFSHRHSGSARGSMAAIMEIMET